MAEYNEPLTKEKLEDYIRNVEKRGYQCPSPPILPQSLIDSYAENELGYAYVFPVDPNESVKIVLEQEPLDEDKFIKEIYEKFQELNNGNK